MASAKPMHILAFGDSLTEGWTNQFGNHELFYPYAEKLQKLFNAHKAGAVNVRNACVCIRYT